VQALHRLNLEIKIALVICDDLAFDSLKTSAYSSARHFIGFKTFVHVDEIAPGTISAGSGGKPFALQYSTPEQEFVRGAVAYIRNNYQRMVKPRDFPQARADAVGQLIRSVDRSGKPRFPTLHED